MYGREITRSRLERTTTLEARAAPGRRDPGPALFFHLFYVRSQFCGRQAPPKNGKRHPRLSTLRPGGSMLHAPRKQVGMTKPGRQ